MTAVLDLKQAFALPHHGNLAAVSNMDVFKGLVFHLSAFYWTVGRTKNCRTYLVRYKNKIWQQPKHFKDSKEGTQLPES